MSWWTVKKKYILKGRSSNSEGKVEKKGSHSVTDSFDFRGYPVRYEPTYEKPRPFLLFCCPSLVQKIIQPGIIFFKFS